MRSRTVLGVLAVTPVLRGLVAAGSVPAGQPDRSGCDRCGHPIGLGHGLRALSPLARCANCPARIGAPPGSLELVMFAVLGVLLYAARSPGETLAHLWWGLCAVPLLFIDLAVRRLPDRLTYPAAAGTWLLLGLAALATGDGQRWSRAVLAAGTVAAFFAATTLLLGRRGFGLGDAKLALSAAALLGWHGWPIVLFGLVAALAGAAVVSLALLVTRRTRWSSHLPFGPFLVLGTLTALALSS